MFDMVCTCNLDGVGYDELLCFRFVLVSCPSVLFCVSLTWMSVFPTILGFCVFDMACTCNVMICYVLMVIA